MAEVVTSISAILYNSKTFYALILGLIIVWLAYILVKDRKYNLPPGPRSLPIFGNLLLFRGYPNIYKLMGDMSKLYGPVIKFDLVTTNMVVLHTPETALEMLIKRSEDFAGRPKLFSLNVISEGGNSLVLGQYGPRWQLHRRITAQALRNFISGPMLEERVHRSWEAVGKAMAEQNGPVDPKRLVSLLIFNIISGMCFNICYSEDDEEFQRISKTSDSITEVLGTGVTADFISILQYLPLKQNRTLYDLNAKRLAYIQSKIDSHLATFDPDDLRDLTDFFLQAKREAEKEDSETAAMITDVHVRQTIGDMFGAGIDTTWQTIYWALYFMAVHPGVQQKVQEEIDSIIDRNRLPGLRDKGKLIYTEATMNEVMRLGPVVPIGVPHRAMCDSTIAGYDIPKGTTVAVNFYALHHDPEYWQDAEKFIPERFLGKNGKMAPKPPSFLPFSAGRRVCLGESAAKPALILVFSCIMQKFRIVFADGKGPAFEPNCKGFGYRAPPYEILFQERD